MDVVYLNKWVSSLNPDVHCTHFSDLGRLGFFNALDMSLFGGLFGKSKSKEDLKEPEKSTPTKSKESKETEKPTATTTSKSKEPEKVAAKPPPNVVFKATATYIEAPKADLGEKGGDLKGRFNKFRIGSKRTDACVPEN